MIRVTLEQSPSPIHLFGHQNTHQRVRQGQVIARSGDTGFADRPELHFEIRRGRTPVDPLGQLPRT